MTHNEKLQNCMKEKEMVEVLTEDREIVGIISDIGDDYVAITYMIERTIEDEVEVEDGKKEKRARIQVIELETILRLSDIKAVSRILKKKFK